MLYKHKTKEVIDSKGEHMLQILNDLEPVPCERCGAESISNCCEGDGRMHHHGFVHTVDNHLQALCEKCAKVAKQEWINSRNGKTYQEIYFND